MAQRTPRPIPAETVKTLARSVYSQASTYGFTRVDHIRLATALLSLCNEPPVEPAAEVAAELSGSTADGVTVCAGTELPLCSTRLIIDRMTSAEQCQPLERWLRDGFCTHFLTGCASPQPKTLPRMLANPGNTFGLIRLPAGSPIGVVAYLDHDRAHARAELRLLIGDPGMRRRGLGREAVGAWIDYGLRGLALEKIFVHVLESDVRSARLLEQLGFDIEGLLRDEVCAGTVRQNVMRMAFLKAPGARTADASEEDT